MKALNEEIKSGQLKKVYLLYGEEAYLKKMYKERLRKAALPEGDTMNYAYYEGKNVNVKEVIDLSETLPFFADRRLIILENTGLFKSAATDLSDYIKEIPDTSCLVFIETEVDKRGKMFKAVKAQGRVTELPFQDEKTLKRWILGFMKKEQKQITEATLNHFLDKVGTDMENIQGELEKLFCYTQGKAEITVEDIEAICVTQITNRIFEMVNAAAEGRQREALELYYDLIALKEPAMRILYLLTRQVRLLMQVKEMQDLHFAQKEIASKAGIHPYAAKKYMAQTRYFSKERMREAVEESARLEQDVKTGKLSDTLAVEIFIIELSKK
nr:DNA polymerase III subunit delta [uncultured Mediterraneibacter sp.]